MTRPNPEKGKRSVTQPMNEPAELHCTSEFRSLVTAFRNSESRFQVPVINFATSPLHPHLLQKSRPAGAFASRRVEKNLQGTPALYKYDKNALLKVLQKKHPSDFFKVHTGTGAIRNEGPKGHSFEVVADGRS